MEFNASDFYAEYIQYYVRLQGQFYLISRIFLSVIDLVFCLYIEQRQKIKIRFMNKKTLKGKVGRIGSLFYVKTFYTRDWDS
jgi:hypothetical protein